MTATAPDPVGAPTGRPPWLLPPPASEERVIAGVAAGLARELTVDLRLVRLAFVLLGAAGGWGVVLYGAAWAAMAWRTRGRAWTPPPAARGRSPAAAAVGFGLVVLGLLAAIDTLGTGLSGRIVVPVGLLGLGLVLAWHRSDAVGAGPSVPQVAAGLLLALGGVTALLVGNLDLGQAGPALAAVAAVTAGLALLSAPWWLRLVDELGRERQRRIRADERAEVAAHLHDSVLQTLSLIQRHDHDPAAMVALARRQERELRNWLDPARASRLGGSLRGQLDELASEVEQLHGATVEVVTVGDCLVDEAVAALVAAAREATVNAAKHSGAARVDVFAEVGPDAVEVFVRDTGQGFDPDAVGADRRGLRDSVCGRMERVGGQARLVTAPGQGTEVELRLPRVASTRGDGPEGR